MVKHSETFRAPHTIGNRRFTLSASALTLALLAGTLVPMLPAASIYIKSSGLVRPTTFYWVALCCLIAFFFPQIHTPGRLRYRSNIITLAFLGACIMLAVRFCFAIAIGAMEASPYDHSPLGVIYNLADTLSMLIAAEMIRAYALGTAYRNARHPLVWAIVMSLLIGALRINFLKVLVLRDMQAVIVYIAQDVLPCIAQSVLLTVLALYGGVLASVLYSGAIEVFMFVFPVLPSLPWLAESAFGIAVPVLMALFVWEYYERLLSKFAVAGRKNIVGFIVALGCAVLFFWFVIGVFPVYPSVVLTGSMEPLIKPGDVVLIRKFYDESEIYKLSEGDVISFMRGDILITHRISHVLYDEDDNISFQTKGDNNDSADSEIVMPADIRGGVEYTIPKAGIITLMLHSGNPVPEGVEDIGQR